MTRTITAGALTNEHIGSLVSHHGAATPRRLRGLGAPGPSTSTSLVFVYLQWDWPYETTCVTQDADITIHDDPEGGRT